MSTGPCPTFQLASQQDPSGGGTHTPEPRGGGTLAGSAQPAATHTPAEPAPTHQATSEHAPTKGSTPSAVPAATKEATGSSTKCAQPKAPLHCCDMGGLHNMALYDAQSLCRLQLITPPEVVTQYS